MNWALLKSSVSDGSVSGSGDGKYPSKILDLIIFHKLHLGLPTEDAMKSYQRLRERFVDWNETRISSVREIQEAIDFCPGSLELAVFITNLLEFVHREHQHVSLEFLAEQNLGDIRQYLKQVKGVDSATVELILLLRKEYPIFPLSEGAETVLRRLGILRATSTPLQRGKQLHGLVEPARALHLHHFLLNHSREVCPPDETRIDCPHCGVREMCAFYARTKNKNRRKSASRDVRKLVPQAARKAGARSKRGKSRKSVGNSRTSTRRIVTGTAAGRKVRK
jgi:endonuclease III